MPVAQVEYVADQVGGIVVFEFILVRQVKSFPDCLFSGFGSVAVRLATLAVNAVLRPKFEWLAHKAQVVKAS
jgi:hypothetical protein